MVTTQVTHTESLRLVHQPMSKHKHLRCQQSSIGRIKIFLYIRKFRIAHVPETRCKCTKCQKWGQGPKKVDAQNKNFPIYTEIFWNILQNFDPKPSKWSHSGQNETYCLCVELRLFIAFWIDTDLKSNSKPLFTKAAAESSRAYEIMLQSNAATYVHTRGDGLDTEPGTDRRLNEQSQTWVCGIGGLLIESDGVLFSSWSWAAQDKD